MTLSVSHICRTCHADDYIEACGRCHTAFYCSEKCQKMDWETHKRFCIKSKSKDLEVQRRTLCLKLIHETELATFKFLFEQRFNPTKSVFLYIENRRLKYFFKYSFEKLRALNVISERKKYEELDYELSRQVQTPGMVVLDTNNKGARVYVIMKNDLFDLIKPVNDVPLPVVDQIFDIVYQELMDGVSPSVLALNTAAAACLCMTEESGGKESESDEEF